MAKKEKKPLTPKQKKNRLRAAQYGCISGEFITALMPYIVIGAVNFDEYFVQTGADAWKVSLGGMLAMAVMGITIWSLGHEKTKQSKTHRLVAFALGWLVSAFILFLLSSIIYDVAMIMFCGALGIFAALGLDIASNSYKAKADRYKEYLENNEFRDTTIEMDADYEAKKQAKIEAKRKKGLM